MLPDEQLCGDATPLLDCPSCGLPAEITGRLTLHGVPAPVQHMKVVCPAGQWYTLPVDGLTRHERPQVDEQQRAAGVHG